MRFPVAMTTYERVEYFSSTVASLRACGEDMAVTIYDDLSVSAEKTAALSSCGYRVVLAQQNTGPYIACVNAVNAAWENEDCEYLIYTQDDVEFSKGCFSAAVSVAELIRKDGLKLGILSLYHRARKLHAAPYNVMHVGHPGAICWLITRKFWNDFSANGVERPVVFPPNDERKKHFIRDLADYKICRWAQMHGYTIAYPRLSLVQHTGDRSSLSERDMSFCKSQFYVGDYGKEKTE